MKRNAVNGALVIQVTANDKDIGENSKITYHILEGSYGKFIINQTSGVITTAGGLSFKEMSKYTVIVSARDNGLSPRTASALVYITITSAVYLGGAATVWAITAILVLSLGLNVLSCLWLMRRLKQDRRKGTQCTCNQRKQNKKDLKAESYDNELEMDDNMTSAVTASFSQQPTETGPEYETIQQPRENTTALDAKRSNDPSQYQGLNLTPITLAQQNQGPVYEPLRTRSVESMPLRNDNVQHSYEPLNTRNQTDDYQSLQSNSRELVI